MTIKEEHEKRVLDFIKKELTDALSNVLFNTTKFPVEFENEIGKWHIEADGTATVSVTPENTPEKIEVKINIKTKTVL